MLSREGHYLGYTEVKHPPEKIKVFVIGLGITLAVVFFGYYVITSALNTPPLAVPLNSSIVTTH